MTKATKNEFDVDPKRLRRVPKNQRHLAKPGDTDPPNIKVKISMWVDEDILEHFKGRAGRPDAAPYQTQINNALRRAMEIGQQDPTEFDKLLKDERFIEAVAQKVRASARKQ